MIKKIKIKSGNIIVEAKLNNTKTADAIYKALPIEGIVNTWGDEIYFSISVILDLEKDAKEIVEKGDLGYWPSGNAFCIFFGPTPISENNEIRPASKVNVFGQIISDIKILKNIEAGSKISVFK
ncbi:MAG: cyclophilin-like fold protein [Actinomycetota bacterium]